MDQLLIPLLANQYIQSMVEKVREQIIANNIHRWELQKYELRYAAPDPSIFSLEVLIKKLLFAGADKLEAKDVQYDPATSTIQFEMCAPRLLLQSGDSSIIVNFLGHELGSNLSGRIVITDLRIYCKTDIVVNEGGLRTDNWDIKLSVGSISSNLNFAFLDTNYSATVNGYLKDKLPQLINLFGDKVKETLEPLLKDLLQIQNRNEINNMF